MVTEPHTASWYPLNLTSLPVSSRLARLMCLIGSSAPDWSSCAVRGVVVKGSCGLRGHVIEGCGGMLGLAALLAVPAGDGGADLRLCVPALSREPGPGGGGTQVCICWPPALPCNTFSQFPQGTAWGTTQRVCRGTQGDGASSGIEPPQHDFSWWGVGWRAGLQFGDDWRGCVIGIFPQVGLI